MTKNRIKLLVTAVLLVPMLAVAAFYNNQVGAFKRADDDAAAVYKTKCAACHSPKAEKNYDPAMPEADQVQIILKGKKGEKPPFMPGYEAKGMTEDQAKALAQYMKSLRTPSN